MVNSPCLVSLLVVDFLDPLLARVSAINSLGIIVRDIGDLTRLRYRVLVIVNEFDELTSLLISHLYVLTYHVFDC